MLKVRGLGTGSCAGCLAGNRESLRKNLSVRQGMRPPQAVSLVCVDEQRSRLIRTNVSPLRRLRQAGAVSLYGLL